MSSFVDWSTYCGLEFAFVFLFSFASLVDIWDYKHSKMFWNPSVTDVTDATDIIQYRVKYPPPPTHTHTHTPPPWRHHVFWCSKCRFTTPEDMMLSSNGNIFRVIAPLWGKSNGDRWIPLNIEQWHRALVFLWSAPERTAEQSIDTPVIIGRYCIGQPS